MRSALLWTGIAALGVTLSAPARADMASDIATAQAEAKLARQSNDIDTIRLHIHRSANCLFGRDSYFYDRSVGPSCDTRVGAVGESTGVLQKKRLYDAGIDILSGDRVDDIQRGHDSIDDGLKLLESAKASNE